MGKPDDFDLRLKSYLRRGASTPPPAGFEARIVAGLRRRRSGWLLQVAAAAAVLVLAVGLGIAVQRARQSGGVTPTATPFASPNVNPTPTPTPSGPYPLLPPVSLRMINATTGWAAGSGTNRILRTADGGSHWDDAGPRGAQPGNWTTFFLDANNAWVASSLQPGSGSADYSVEIYRTADGGRTWQRTGTAMADAGWPAGLDFVDSRHGWLFMRLGAAAGSEGVAFYGTVDGGATWSKLSQTDQSLASGDQGHLPLGCSKLLGSPAGWGPTCMCTITSLRFSDARNGVFVLTSYASAGVPESVVYSTADGGGSWRPGPLLPAQAYDVFFIDRSHGWTLNAKSNSLLSSSDGGQHWSLAGPIPSTQGVMGFQFVTTEIGWATGSEPAGNTLIKTTDGGQTWTTQLSP